MLIAVLDLAATPPLHQLSIICNSKFWARVEVMFCHSDQIVDRGVRTPHTSSSLATLPKHALESLQEELLGQL